MSNQDFLTQLKLIVGAAYVLTDEATTAPYYKEYRGRFRGTGLAVIRPADTQEVAAVVRLCATHRVAIVPQGGNTGMVGGSIPYDAHHVVLSLSRLNTIRAVDAENYTMTVEAGCVLHDIQQRAASVDRLFPLSLGSEGSCQIGGNIASNAGGILTMRYGNTRDLVLGLEVVLPNGEIWNGLRSLRKDNTGYDVKHLFIGSEGTLGIITAAVLKLYPDPGVRQTFFAAVETVEQAVTLLSTMRGTFGENLLAFELLAQRAVSFAVQYNPQCTMPLQQESPWYVLGEIAQYDGGREAMENALAAAFDAGLITDATLAHNDSQRQMFWTMRESVSDAQRYVGASIKHDISVPITQMADFIREGCACVLEMIPDARPVVFGHAGDGNLHFNITRPEAMENDVFLARWDEVNHAVHDIVQKYNGSIAAEHGIGTFKAQELVARKSPVDMAMMRAVKNALDPHHLMNPGKVLLPWTS